MKSYHYADGVEDITLAEGRRQGMLVETIHGVRTVKSLALEPVLQRKWNDTAAYAISRYFNVAKISMTARTLSHWLERLTSGYHAQTAGALRGEER